MKPFAFGVALAIAAWAVQPTLALAQSPPPQTRAERKAQGVEAARGFQPGEGNPIPDSRPKVSGAERAQAREARKPVGTAAAQSFRPGEGDPKPAAVAKRPRAERRDDRSAKRAEVRADNKAGRIPNYGETYGGTQK